MADIPPAGAPFPGNLGIYSAPTAIKPSFWRSPSLCSLERALRNLFSSRRGIQDGRRPTSNANLSRRFLAATAIGTKVKFWKYDAPDLQLESDVPTLAPNSEVLDLSQARGQNEAIQMLAYVRNEGFDWTESGKDGTHRKHHARVQWKKGISPAMQRTSIQ